MTIIQKTIGRLPVNLGDYDSTRAYGKKNRVTLYDCEWESKVDNNTYPPATLVNGVVTPDTTHWRLNSGVPGNYGLDAEIGADNQPGTVKGRIKSLEDSVGTGGTVDQKIASAVQTEAARATGAESALSNRVTSLETEVGSGGGSNTLSSRVTALESGKADKATTIAGYGITDAYTQASGQALETSVNETLAEQNSKIDLLNGSEVVVVEDHTAVSEPDSQIIYRQYGTTSYTDWMYQNSAWQDIATYSMPGLDNEPTAGSENLVKSGGVSEVLGDILLSLAYGGMTSDGAILPSYIVGVHSDVFKGPIGIAINNGFYIHSVWIFANAEATQATSRATDYILSSDKRDFKYEGSDLLRIEIRKNDGTNFNTLDGIIKKVETNIIYEVNKIAVNRSRTLKEEATINKEITKDRVVTPDNFSIPNYFIRTDGALIDNNGLDATDYISVMPNTRYIGWVYPGTGSVVASVCQYDENKQFITGTAISLTELDFVTNTKTRYIRMSTDHNYKGYAYLKVEKAINSTFQLFIPKLYPKANLPVCAFSFDSAHYNDQQIVDLFDSHHVTCNFAVRYIYAQRAKDFYGDLQKRGYDICAHGSEKFTEDEGWTTQTAGAKFLEMKTTLENVGLQISGLIAPRSIMDAVFVPECEKVFAYCFAGASDNTRQTNPCTLARFSAESNCLQASKDYLDDCIANDKICVFYGHSDDFGTTYTGEYNGQSWSEEWNITKLESLLEYALLKRDARQVYIDSLDNCIKYFFGL